MRRLGGVAFPCDLFQLDLQGSLSLRRTRELFLHRLDLFLGLRHLLARCTALAHSGGFAALRLHEAGLQPGAHLFGCVPVCLKLLALLAEFVPLFLYDGQIRSRLGLVFPGLEQGAFRHVGALFEDARKRFGLVAGLDVFLQRLGG